MRYQGKITNWKDDQGFGFITPNGGGDQVFVHIKSFVSRQIRPVGNEIVTYKLTADAKGRKRAESVAFVGQRTPTATSFGPSNIPVIFTAVFLIVLAGLAIAGKLPFALPGLYLIASAVVFLVYVLDKSAARNDQRRIPENTLHVLALVGGWPGALAAQRLIRHKSKKRSFQLLFWTTVILNCGGLIWLLSPNGAVVLRSILS
jgi:uncharacterized membrane protein YsdA (DUF1294 family)/cold shock CspA family protein